MNTSPLYKFPVPEGIFTGKCELFTSNESSNFLKQSFAVKRGCTMLLLMLGFCYTFYNGRGIKETN